MAIGKIRFEDIFETDVFQQAADSAKALIEVLTALDETLKRIAKTKLDNLAAITQQTATAEGIKQTATALKEAEQAMQQASKATKQLEKAKQKLMEIESEVGKEIAKVRHQTREAQKDLRAKIRSEEAAIKSAELLKKAQEGLYESYHDMSETLEKLRTRYKDLVAAGQANTKEAQEMYFAIVQLDSKIKGIDESVGQFQRNVGSYLQSMRNFWGELSNQARNAGGLVGGLVNQILGLGAAFRAAGGGLAGLGNAVKFLGRSITASGIGLLLVALNETLGRLLSNLRGVFAGGEDLQRALAGLGASMKKLQLEYEIENLSILVEQNQDNIELINKYYDKQLQLLRMTMNEALRQYNVDKQIYEANAKILGNKEKATEAVQRMQQQLEIAANAEREILRLTHEREKAIKAIIDRQRELAEQQERERQQRLQELLQVMELEEERARTTIEQITKDYEKQVEEIRRASNAAWELAKTEEERLMILERLDAKMQQVDRQYYERVLQVRQQLYDRLVELDAEITDNIIKRRLQQYSYEQRRLRAEMQQMIAELEQLGDVEALKQAKELQLQMEQKFARDIADMQVELHLQQLQREREYYEQSLNLRAREFASVKEFEEWKSRQLLEYDVQLHRKRLQYLLEQKKEYEAALIDTTALDAMIAKEEAALAMLELRHREMIERLQDATQSADNAMQDTLKNIANNFEKTVELIDTLMQRVQARQEQMLDYQLTMTRRRIDLLIAQVERGSDAATDSIIELEKREVDIIRQQEQIKRRAQQREAALSAFRAYASQLQQGATPAQALLNTIRDLTLLTQMIRALPTFYGGTEYVGKPNISNAVQDAVLARLHVGERVVPADINKRLRNIRNEQLPQLVERSEKVEMDYDSMLNAISLAVKSNNKQTRIIRKI